MSAYGIVPLTQLRCACRLRKVQRSYGTHEQAYNILLINVTGAIVLGVSITYATTVGRDEAIASVMIDPEADQVKISICPGVSMRMWLPGQKDDMSTHEQPCGN